MNRKKRRHKIIKTVVAVGLLLCFMFPQYARRLVYPHLIGQPTKKNLQISANDFFEDVTAAPFKYERGNRTYTLLPRTKYAVTGRVGIIDDYDTLWNKIYRGQFQGEYITLVPRDLMVVIGQMGRPEIFKMFEFEHEERLGRVLCKGVKYRTSFMPSFMSAKKASENWHKYQECNQYIKNEEYNNYHPIPANERINKALGMLVKGDVVHIEGILVDVPEMGLNTGTRKEQTHRNMAVNGMAPGMCFILYTTRVILNNRMYE